MSKLALLVKSSLAFFIIVGVLRICNAYYVIHPCDDNDSCRFFKIRYVDDDGHVYVYKKTYCDSSTTPKGGESILPFPIGGGTKCYDFIAVLSLFICLMGVINYVLTKDLRHSCTLSLMVMVMFVFFPSLTLHAVNSNEYKTKIFQDFEDSSDTPKKYKFQPSPQGREPYTGI